MEDCRIDEVADIAGIGAVWFYKDRVANILSQHRIATLSKCDIDYTTKKYKISGDADDLTYNVTTTEGI